MTHDRSISTPHAAANVDLRGLVEGVKELSSRVEQVAQAEAREIAELSGTLTEAARPLAAADRLLAELAALVGRDVAS